MELKERARLICMRRNKKLLKLESVALTTRAAFGLANLTPLLPAIANTFYIVEVLHITTLVLQVTQPVRLRVPNLGGGSTGDVELPTTLTLNAKDIYYNIECDSMHYVVNGNTAGAIAIVGTVWKVTMGEPTT